jgi:hypothetical protein
MTTAMTRASGTIRVHPESASQMISAAVDCPSRGKKLTMQEEFEKLLQKKCPWHPGANHAAIDCYHLQRTFSNPNGGKKNKKPVDKKPEDDDQGDQAHNAKFQDASKTVNVIFGGDGDFGSRWEKNCFFGRSCPLSQQHHDHSRRVTRPRPPSSARA